MGVEGVRIGGVESGQLQEDARGESRPETGPVAGFQVAGPGDRSGGFGDLVTAERGNLFADQRFEAGGAGGDKAQGLFLLCFGGRVCSEHEVSIFSE